MSKKVTQHTMPCAAPPPAARTINYRRLWTGLILAAGLGLPWCKIGVPLNYDEAATISYYASRPFRFIVTDYAMPNNHVAYSLMLHAWSLLIGDPVMLRPDTWVLRLPSLLLFTVGVAALFLACRRLLSPDPLVCAAAVFFGICQPGMLDYALRLRGYGPAAAWLSVVLALAAYHDRLPRWFFALALAATLFIFNYTLPSNLWFALPLAAGMILWPLALRRGWLPTPNSQLITHNTMPWFSGALAAAFLATGLAYLPLREQLAKWSQIEHTLSSLAHSLVMNSPKHAQMALQANAYGYSIRVAGALALAGLVAIGCGARGGNPEARRAALLVAITLVLFPVAASLLSPTGYARNYVVFAPVMGLTCAWGVKGLVHLATGLAPAQGPRLAAALPVLLLLLASGHAGRHLAFYSRDFMPDKIARHVAKNHPGVALLYGNDADPFAMRYYTNVAGIGLVSCFYENVEVDTIQQMTSVLVLASEPESKKIFDRFKMNAESYDITAPNSFGKLKLYELNKIPQ